jgi:hypothetical protein
MSSVYPRPRDGHGPSGSPPGPLGTGREPVGAARRAPRARPHLRACGVAGLSVAADSLSAVKYSRVTVIRDATGLAVDSLTAAARLLTSGPGAIGGHGRRERREDEVPADRVRQAVRLEVVQQVLLHAGEGEH